MAEAQQDRVQSAVESMVQDLELNHIRKMQDRLARCTMHCNDKAKDSFDSGSKEPVVRAQLERCVSACVDEHLNLLPSMTRKLRDTLDSIGK
ncbi:UNVERIFIED_CONTAM: hypothetical protein FKN15_014658 [Acipenser sinensis]